MTQTISYVAELPELGSHGNVWSPVRPITRTPARPANEISFSLVTTRAGFDTLEADWCALHQRAGRGHQVFQSFHWLWHWCNHFYDQTGSGHSLSIVTGHKHGKLVLVWPLAVQRVGGLRHLIWMGRPVSQYGDALVDEGECSPDDLHNSWRFVARSVDADLMLLGKVRSDAAVAPVLQAACKTPIARTTAPYLQFENSTSFDAYQQRYSAKARKNRRRLRRRIAERSTLDVVSRCGGPQCAEMAANAVHLKRTWLKDRGLVSAAIQDDRTIGFFRDAANSSQHPTGCRTTVLQIDGQPAAIEVSFVHKGHCAVHVIVYDVQHEKSGAGVLLLEDAVAFALESGIQTFDLMAPGDKYKFDWADGSIDVYDWSLPLSRLGQIYTALQFGKLPAILKPLMQAMPLMMRKFLHTGFSWTR